MLWFIFSINRTVKGQEYQIHLPGRIYYNFVQSTQTEGICIETLRHVMVKVKR